MTWEWHIGDPVDDATGGSMDAQNWGHGSDDNEDDNTTSEFHKRDEYSKKGMGLLYGFQG